MAAKHLRHKEPTELKLPRSLILACPQFRSGVNLARMVRLAGCAGISKMVVCGSTKVDAKIARDAIETVEIIRKRTLNSWLAGQAKNFRVVGLEQSDSSHNLFDYRYERDSILLIGNERHGIQDELLNLVDDIIEIPVYGRPLSYNVVTATTMAVYEYCRQFPDG